MEPSLNPTALPLDGLLVLDFSQFLAGPSAALRLADLGATVIKIERPESGDLCRQLYISNLELDGDSTLFHTINRNKRSFAADLKKPGDLSLVKKLIGKADVLIENFRPLVMERLGLSYKDVQAINPKLVYGTVTGYGSKGPWAGLPGQDLLVQSRAGLVWLNGDADQGPVPMGLAVADIMTGAHLVQGILAALVRRGMTGKGAQIEVSLLESLIDIQFEVLTTHLNDGYQLPERAKIRNAHAYLGAPYGLYETANGYMALAMGSLANLSTALNLPALQPYLTNAKLAFTERDAIKALIANHLKTKTKEYWIEQLQKIDYWCAPVMGWDELLQHEGFRCLDMVQTLINARGASITTTKCPIRINGVRPSDTLAAPKVGEHNGWVAEHYL